MFNNFPTTPSPFVVPIHSNMDTSAFFHQASSDVQQKHTYIEAVLTRSKMTVSMLKNVLKGLSLASTGLKQALQERLMMFLSTASNVDLFTRHVISMHDLIKAELNGKAAPAAAPASRGPYGNTVFYNTPQQPQSLAAKVKTMLPASDLVVNQAPPLSFSDSPFYKVKEAILPGMILSKSAEQKATRMEFKLPDYYIRAVQEETEQRKHGTVHPKYAIRLFGQILQPESTARTASCEFPIALQLKVNDKAVESNTRGMKNKRGTTVPPDVSDLIKHQKPTQRLETYYSHCADTRYGIWAYVVEAQSMTQVLNDIKTKRIAREKPLQIIKSFYSDEDVVVDNYPLKLKCPVSFSRMEIPVRSVFCKHVQCFDGRSFLQMQHQAAQWRCPVCDDPMAYASLAVDEFMTEILAQAPESADNVCLLKDGSYEIPQEDSEGEASSPEPEWLKKRHPDPPLVVSLDSSDDEAEAPAEAPAPAAPATPVAPVAAPPISNGSGVSSHRSSIGDSSRNGTSTAASSHAPLDVPSQETQDTNGDSQQYQHPLPVPPAVEPSRASTRPERSGSTHSTSSIPDPKRRRTSLDFVLPPWTGGILGNSSASAYPDVITMVDDSSSDSMSPPQNLPTLPKSYSSNEIGLPSWDSGIFATLSKNTNKHTSASPDTAATSVSPNANGGSTPLGRSNAVRRGPRPQKTVVEVVDLTLSD